MRACMHTHTCTHIVYTHTHTHTHIHTLCYKQAAVGLWLSFRCLSWHAHLRCLENDLVTLKGSVCRTWRIVSALICKLNGVFFLGISPFMKEAECFSFASLHVCTLKCSVSPQICLHLTTLSTTAAGKNDCFSVIRGIKQLIGDQVSVIPPW